MLKNASACAKLCLCTANACAKRCLVMPSKVKLSKVKLSKEKNKHYSIKELNTKILFIKSSK